MQHHKWLLGVCAAALLADVSGSAHAQTATPSASPGDRANATNSLTEIVVTARRRAENAQTVPVSVTALSATALTEQNVQQIQDINTTIPGFRFAAEGGRDNTDVVLRGLSKLPLGIGIPAVVTYVGDVPLPGIAGDVPVYDLQSVQVLKGPQGTLFGRNTLGGAVVLSPTLPGNDLTGYIDVQAGNLGRYSLEGAVTLPIVQDKLSVRVAGQMLRGDGYIKNLSGGPNLSNTDVNSGRVTILFKPTEYIKNTTIFDYSDSPQTPAGEWLYKTNPGVFGALLSSQALGSALDAQTLAAEKSSGPLSQYTDSHSAVSSHSRGYGVSNDTRFTLNDSIQLRNIFGYRYVYSQQGADVSATPDLQLGQNPFFVFDADQVLAQRFITDEMQVIGKSWDDRLNWIVGGFYNTDSPAAPSGSTYNAFGQTAPAITGLFKDENKAVYGQASLDLSHWLIHGLTIDLGYRYSWDKQQGCGGAVNGGATYSTWSQCAAQGPNAIVTASGGDPSWNIGLNYKLSDHQFFYAVTRRGYRGVNVNVPYFSSVYTTGGTNSACALTLGVCPDLRPLQTTKPEKLTDVEIGSKTDWSYGGMSGRIDIAMYRSWYEDGLQFLNFSGLVPANAPDGPVQDSVGITDNDQTITGVELNTSFRPIPSLTFNFNGAYTDAEVTSVFSPSPFVVITKNEINLPSPKYSGDLGVRWVLPYRPADGDLVFNGDIFYTSNFGASEPTVFPGYSVSNVRLSWLNVAHSNINISLFCKNLFDRIYLSSPVVVLPTFPTNSAIIGTRRTFGIDLRYSL